ncbi:MAG: hypothetical protein K9I47_04410 [Bacteroidales bacterium]|nr:hypothetical protein [Bacteroidales bacterium]
MKISNPFLITGVLIALLIGLGGPVYTQVKYEKESQIKVEDVPAKALSFIKDCHIDAPLRWYREGNVNDASVEAKGRIRGSKYSIEFDTLGNIQDVEFIMDFDEMLQAIRGKVKYHLDSLFKRYKIIKVQKQYTAESQTLQQLIRSGQSNQPFTTRYEIVMAGKKEKMMKKFEMLINSNGEIIKQTRIIPKDMDNLIY